MPDRDTAYIFGLISKLGTGEPLPDPDRRPKPVYEPIVPGGPLPQPKQSQFVHPDDTPQPSAVRPDPKVQATYGTVTDKRLVELAQRWPLLSERERQEIYGLLKLLLYLDSQK